jgi:ABC-type oligopeptide transport system substrate-binding subunit
MPVKNRRLKLAFGSLFLALLAAALVACGGGGGSSTTVVTSSGTPTGNYTATVKATSGTLSQTLNVPVDVQ